MTDKITVATTMHKADHEIVELERMNAVYRAAIIEFLRTGEEKVLVDSLGKKRFKNRG